MITQNTEETLKIFPMPWGLVEIEELQLSEQNAGII